MKEIPSGGSMAPDFSLPVAGGGTISMSKLRGRKVVLYFYPKAGTSGCTKEAMAFSRLRKRFEQAGTEVIGVSADPIPALERFKAKYGLNLRLASDQKRDMLEAYGVWREKNLYGRRSMGIVRTTYLIGPDGRIAKVWPRVKVEGHAEEVLKAAKAL